MVLYRHLELFIVPVSLIVADAADELLMGE
jgi:hypothetical protein